MTATSANSPSTKTTPLSTGSPSVTLPSSTSGMGRVIDVISGTGVTVVVEGVVAASVGRSVVVSGFLVVVSGVLVVVSGFFVVVSGVLVVVSCFFVVVAAEVVLCCICVVVC